MRIKPRNLLLCLLAPVIFSSCSDELRSRIVSLKDIYDGQNYTHAFRWRAGLPPKDWCAFLYRDKRLDTEQDDWMPFFQGLALKIGEEELNARRREKTPDYDNELFEEKEMASYCREIDGTSVELNFNLDHHQIALPEKTRKKLNQLIEGIKKNHPGKSLDYINKLKIHYDFNLFSTP